MPNELISIEEAAKLMAESFKAFQQKSGLSEEMEPHRPHVVGGSRQCCRISVHRRASCGSTPAWRSKCLCKLTAS
jgi:hypothetical protein